MVYRLSYLINYISTLAMVCFCRFTHITLCFTCCNRIVPLISCRAFRAGFPSHRPPPQVAPSACMGLCTSRLCGTLPFPILRSLKKSQRVNFARHTERRDCPSCCRCSDRHWCGRPPRSSGRPYCCCSYGLRYYNTPSTTNNNFLA